MTNDAALRAFSDRRSAHQNAKHRATQARAARRPRGDRAATPADAGVSDVVLGQLLCSRVCHDLIGPTAAINAGQELIDENSSEREAARDLLADSARQLAGRLTFFRAAFGQGGSTGTLHQGGAQRLIEGFLLGGRVALDWDTGDAGAHDILSGEAVRVLLCLVMLAVDTLPRGGRLRVAIARQGSALSLVVIAAGRTARVAEEARHALQATDSDALTARTVHAFYLAGLTRRLGGSIDIDEGGAGEVRIEATIPLPEPAQAAN